MKIKYKTERCYDSTTYIATVFPFDVRDGIYIKVEKSDGFGHTTIDAKESPAWDMTADEAIIWSQGIVRAAQIATQWDSNPESIGVVEVIE